MDNKPKYGNVSIGTDPTFLEKVETLDVTPKISEIKELDDTVNNEVETLDVSDVKKEPQKKEKKKSNVLIIIIISILLIIGVAGGLYFYLHLGTSNNVSTITNVNNTINTNESKQEITNPDDDVTLNNIKVIKDANLSDKLSDYVTFNTSDTLSCKLDLNNVDVKNVGSYEYNVVCDNKKYTGIIYVVDEESLKYSNDIIYEKVGNDITISKLAVSSYADLALDGNLETNIGGPYYANITETVNNNNYIIHSMYYLYEENPAIIMDCEKQVNDYTLIDRYIFNENNDDLKTPLRIYKYSIDENYYYNYILQIEDTGYLKLGDFYGFAVVDNFKKSISIIEELNYEDLNNNYNGEFPTTYGDIKNYYELNGYSCN